MHFPAESNFSFTNWYVQKSMQGIQGFKKEFIYITDYAEVAKKFLIEFCVSLTVY